MRTVTVGTGPVSFADVVAVAREGAGVRLGDDALSALEKGRARAEEPAARPDVEYGGLTGSGGFATERVPPARPARLQRSPVRPHAAGTGPEVEREVVRGTMLLRLSTLATGHTGIRPATAGLLAALLSAGITPVVREYGSPGFSGGLAPCAPALMGEGEVRDASGTLMPAADALAAAGLTPVGLREKEGVSLLVGVEGMLAHLVLALTDLNRLLKTMDIAAAMSVEALLRTDRAFAPEPLSLRPHPGEARAGANLVALLASHRDPDPGCPRVRDAYSLRRTPQVHGAVRDTVDHAAAVAGRELAAAVDSPAAPDDGRVRSDGAFHSAPVGHVLDLLAVAVADAASISERRTDRLLDVARAGGPPGVDSGSMIAQYTQAAIVSELKRIAAPASADSVPPGAAAEGHVPAGWGAARTLRRAVDGLTRVVAVEILTAARALDLRAPLTPSPATAAVVALLRERGIPGPGPDRYLAPEIEDAVALIASGAVIDTVEPVTGTLS
ncbi:aromatic amino acid lyase [Streptomyces niveiscabiei]|uniref:aromatic amino acid lyase n=1 Tax=Streptomyces niveiscabiei TaxID=164115 RepID=UPI0029B5FCD9|nr:aromatic amino acid lyase [Streptomyces niveiscabiei]MDX3385245.1 aromatic amino acid lyase [Streptomyces niveiscabiei]